MVVEEKAEPDHPGGPQVIGMRQHEPQRPDDVRRVREQDFPLFQGLAHEPEFVVFEIAQAPVDQLGRGGGGALREVALLGEQDLEAAPGGVARDARSVDAAADDE